MEKANRLKPEDLITSSKIKYKITVSGQVPYNQWLEYQKDCTLSDTTIIKWRRHHTDKTQNLKYSISIGVVFIKSIPHLNTQWSIRTTDYKTNAVVRF
jgi:hypothetical protein